MKKQYNQPATKQLRMEEVMLDIHDSVGGGQLGKEIIDDTEDTSAGTTTQRGVWDD